MNRSLWIDSCRFLAIFVIMCTHFLAEFSPSTLQFWEIGPLSWLLHGLTGKFSVSFFFVMLGYFASKPASFKCKKLVNYALQRYVYFAFFAFASTALMIAGCYICIWFFHSPGPAAQCVLADGFSCNLIYLLRNSLLFEHNYNVTLWCLPQLFQASLVCRLLGCLPKRLGLPGALLLIPALMLINADVCVWICTAILGYILRYILEKTQPYTLPLPLLILLVAATLLLIKLRMPECVLRHFLQAVAVLMLVFLHFQLPVVQRLLSSAPLTWPGGISMGLFVVHTPVHAIIASSLHPVLKDVLANGLVLIICFIVSLSLSIGFAWTIHHVYGAAEKHFKKHAISV